MYCDKYMVTLWATKTKLLVFTTKRCEMKAKVELATTTLEVDGCTVSHCVQATQRAMAPISLPGSLPGAVPALLHLVFIVDLRYPEVFYNLMLLLFK